MKIIQNVDQSKAHGHDTISLRMSKMCDALICKLLEIIFKLFLTNEEFPPKIATIVPAHKKMASNLAITNV